MRRARSSIASHLSTSNAYRPIESLESRRLLSVAVNSGVLTITGTGSADTYVVTRSGSNIVVVENGGGPQNFATSSVTTITASLGGGGDSLLISDDVTQRSTINGEAGNDTLDGGGGDDVIDGGIGNDSIDGGAGNDTVSYASRSEAIIGSLTVNYTYVSSDSVALIAYSGTAGATGETDTYVAVETLAGGSGNDTLTGTAVLFTQAAAAPHALTVVGNGGDDTLNISGGGNYPEFENPNTPLLPSFPFITAFGNDGNDTFSGGGPRNSGPTLVGGNGDDQFIFHSDGLTATVIPGDGTDTYDTHNTDLGNYQMPPGLERFISYGPLSIKVFGSDDANTIEVNNGGGATIFGGGGDDLIRTTAAGGDELHGDTGDDTIYAGEGNDRVYGDAGDDRLNGDGGKDSIYGGDGDDRVYGNSGSDRLFGDAGVDRLYGGNKNDYLDGGAGADYLKGDEDVDTAKRDKKDRREESIEIFV